MSSRERGSGFARSATPTHGAHGPPAVLSRATPSVRAIHAAEHRNVTIGYEQVSVANANELRDVLAAPRALGRCLARHAFGMRCWVELMGRTLGRFERPADLAVMARLVGDNARHMLLFRARAIVLGVDPDGYRAPPVGAVIYERLEGLTDASDMAAFALGSLDHFSVLLSIYRSVADDDTSAVIDKCSP